MRSLLLAAVVVLASSSALADDKDFRGRGHGHNRPANAQVVVDRAELLARLERMEELLEDAYERMDHGKSRNKVRKAMEQLEDVGRAVANAPDVRTYYPPQPQPQPPPPPPVPAVQPIEQGRLNQLVAAMAREGFPNEKLTVLRQAAPHNYFLVGQLRPMLEQFSFSNDRLEAVRVLWPRVLDRNNAFHLYEAFPFSNDKKKLQEILGG